MLYRVVLGVVASIVGILAAQTGSAATTVFSSRVEFLNSLKASKNISLNDALDGASLFGNGIVVDGINLSVTRLGYNSDSNIIYEVGGAYDQYSLDGSRFAIVDLVPNATFTIDIVGQSNAVGFDLSGFANGRRLEQIDIYAGQNIVLSLNEIDPDGEGYDQAFFGVKLTGLISKIAITHRSDSINDLFGVDNIVVANSAGAVPEPATWMMMIFGFGLVGYSLRKRQTVKAAVRFA